MDGTLVGVVVGGLIAVVGQNAIEFFKNRRERKKAKSLVRAYLVGLIDITEQRGHVKLAEGVLERWRAGDDIPFAYFGSESLRNDLIETGELSKQTGYLNKDDAGDLARFIAAMQAIRINMAMLSNPTFKEPRKYREAHRSR